jgi:hypothetical protein
MFDAVGEAVDKVGSNLDALSNALGGAVPGAGAGPATPAAYCKGCKVDAETTSAPGSFAPVDLGVLDGPAPIEFVHFGHTHLDYSDKFGHEQPRSDTEGGEPDAEAAGRGVRYRAALQREALCVAGFVSETKRSLEDYEKAKGGVGDVMAMAGDLFGGGGGSGGPKASDLDSFGNKVKDTAKPIVADAFDYPKMHKAGIDLQQALADYEAFRNQLIEKPPGKAEGGAGSLGALGGLDAVGGAIAGAMGPVGDVVKLIQGIAFKPFDAALGIHLRLAKELEPVIAEACRELTIESIRKKRKPVYDVWRPAPESGGAGGGGTGIGAVDGAIGDVKKFFEGAPPKTPTSPYLERIFGAAKWSPGGLGAEEETPEAGAAGAAASGPELDLLVVQAFEQALDVGALPGFVATLMREIMKLDIEFVRETYQRLLAHDPAKAIDEADFYRGGRQRLMQRLVDILVGMVEFLKTAKEFSIGVQGTDISPGKLLDQAIDKLNQEAGGKLDPALALALGKLFERLEGARAQAQQDKAGTMEAYLGLLPGVLALNFRNLFFPVWDLLIENTFGRLPFLSDVVKSASSAMNDARSKVDDVRDYQTKADKFVDEANTKGLQAGTGESNIDEYQKALDAKAERKPGQQPGGGGQSAGDTSANRFFPLKGRTLECKSKKVAKSDLDDVKPDLKEIGTPPKVQDCTKAGALHRLR